MQFYFVDIDPETFCLFPTDLSNKISDCSAIIAVHMFGNYCDMLNIKSVAQGRPIIEVAPKHWAAKYMGNLLVLVAIYHFLVFDQENMCLQAKVGLYIQRGASQKFVILSAYGL